MSALGTASTLRIDALASLALGANTLTITSSSTNAGTLTVVGGTLTFSGTTTTNALTGILTATLGATVTFTGNLTNSGAITNTASTFNYGNTWQNLGIGSILDAGGAYGFTGGSAQSLPSGITLGSLVVNKTAGTALTLSGNASTTGAVVLTAGTLSLGSNTLKVGGDWTNNGGTLSSGTGTVNFSTTTNQTINAEPNFYNVTLDTTGTVTLGGNVTSTGTFLQNAGTLDLSSRTLTLAGSGTGSSRPLNLAGGTFTPGTGTVAYTGSATTDIQVANYVHLRLCLTATANITASSTASGNVSLNCGTLSLGSSTLHVGGNWSNGGGTLSGGTGTIDFHGSGAQTLSAEPNIVNLTVNKSAGTLTLSGNVVVANGATTTSGTLDLQTNTLAIGGPFAVIAGGTVTSTTGTLTVTGTASSTGIIATNAGKMLFSSTLQNNGTLSLGTGTATSTGNFTNAGSVLFSGGGLLDLQASFLKTGTGSLTPSTGTIRLSGTGSPSLAGYTYANLILTKTGGGTVSVSASSTLTGTLTTSGAHTLDVSNAGGFNVVGTTTIGSGTTYLVNAASSTHAGSVVNNGALTLTTGLLSVGGDWTDTGTLTVSTGTTTFNGSGAQSIGTEANFSNLTIAKSGGTVTFTGNVTSSQVLTLSSGTLALGANTLTFSGSGTPLVVSGGTLTTTSSTVIYAGSSATNVAPTVYNDAIFRGNGTNSLTASTTIVGTTTVASNSTLAIGTNTLTARGAITNAGLITAGSGGSIIHTSESASVTDENGTEVSTLLTPASVYLTVQDGNRNLNGSSIETITVPVSFSSSAGSDSETITLTETSASSGIFRNTSAIPLLVASFASANNGAFELTNSGNGTLTYLDAQDASDTRSDNVNLTYVGLGGGAVVSHGGGGGLSAHGFVSPLPTFPNPSVNRLPSVVPALPSAVPAKTGTQPKSTPPLPICKPLLLKFIRKGAKNDPKEVRILQDFLRKNEGFSSVATTGFYDTITLNAVHDFQIRYQKDILGGWNLTTSTGYVYKTTLKKINELYCKQQKDRP